jgi:NADPH-dependent 2,4-dienoyl-CoA reductase/sulfur reductase-like enzyme/rhodanese-related sulfurtransferase
MLETVADEGASHAAPFRTPNGRKALTMSPRRVIVVGGVAGGMSAATRLRRLEEDTEITVIERSNHVSYANCGLPYFVGGVIEEEDDLLIQTPERLHERFRLDARVDTEVIGIDPVRRLVTTRSTVDGTEAELPYDQLVLSPGATSVRPPIPGIERAQQLRTVEDAAAMAADIAGHPKTAVVIGAGFIGLETAENLSHAGLSVTIVEAAPQVLTPLDPELAILLDDELRRHGVAVELGVAVSAIGATDVTLADGRVFDADLVVGALGVRPDVRLAELAGLTLGPNGGIAVNDAFQTSDPNIYAVGDAVEKPDAVSGDTSLIALANIANRQGRRAADHVAGRVAHPVDSVGTAIVKVFDLAAGMTGWSEQRLQAAGRRYRAIHSHPYSHATYYPGSTRLAMKLLFDPDDGRILGAQVVGRDGVDKRIDVLATAMAAGCTADGLADLELAYAPQFSSAKDPVNMLGYMAENVRSGDCDVVPPGEVAELAAAGWTVLDVRSESEHADGAIPGSLNVPLDRLREGLGVVGGGPFLVYCAVGQRGHTATALLQDLGYRARNLDGGFITWQAATRAAARAAGRAAGVLVPTR